MVRALRSVLCAILSCSTSGFIVGIDLGSQYLKAAVVAPGKPFEVVHNQHSKRKTPTAVSFQEKVRTFGDDALASAMRGPAKTPMFFPLELGKNHSQSAPADSYWLPKRYYPYKLGMNESGQISFAIDSERSYSIGEITAHIFAFMKALAIDTVDGVAPTETIITVPAHALMLQRKILLEAAAMAGLPRSQLVHETSAAALQRALDLDLSGGPDPTPASDANDTNTTNETNETTTESTPPPPPREQLTSTVLFYNMGSRHVEACIVKYRGERYLNKPTVGMDVLGCGTSSEVGGHQIDLLIADKMLAAFQAKHPKLADGILESKRAIKKLEKEANDKKHVLSANKEAQFRVESLFEDTDFMQPVTRETLEGWCADMFAKLIKPVEEALAASKITLADIEGVEMVGGAWRIPKVQSLLSEYLKKNRPEGMEALNLSQHVNGEEAMATGAAFYGANSSKSFRTKKIFFTDLTVHEYALVIKPLNASQDTVEKGWVRAIELFAAGTKLRARKTVKLNQKFDVQATLLENGNEVARWNIAGVHEAATETYADLETPLVSLKFELDSSGIVRVDSATAIFNQSYNVTVYEKPAAAANGSNASNEEASKEAKDETTEDAQEDAKADDVAKAADEGETKDEANAKDANATVAPDKGTAKIVWKTRKVKVGLTKVEDYDGISPRPLNAEEMKDATDRLNLLIAAEDEVKRIDAAKNALESFVYEARSKVNDDENCQQVSTEEERQKVVDLSMSMEEWLYEEEAAAANASVLEGKIKELKELVNPVLARAYELEQRPLLVDIVKQVLDYVNATGEYVKTNRTWVEAKDREIVANLTHGFNEWYANVTELQAKRQLSEAPAYTVDQAKRMLHKLQTESERLTRIQKIDPIPYSNPYGGGGYGGYGYDDPKMRKYYDDMYKNFSGNKSDHDWFRNGSNFSGNNSDYMKSFYEHMAKNFSGSSQNETDGSGDGADKTGGEGAGGSDKTEL